MSAYPGTAINRGVVRELAGLFGSRESLDVAVDRLLLAGVDRSEIDVMAGMGAVGPRFGVDDLVELSLLPRQAHVGRADIMGLIVMAVTLLAWAGAVVSAFTAIGCGFPASGVIGAAVAGGSAALTASILSARSLLHWDDARMLGQVRLGGLPLWVRAPSAMQEQELEAILLDCGAETVRIREVGLRKPGRRTI